ncbi:hypothetical protein DFH06DRAFT_1192782 [Mycena polygramma]|nr:hypothetical protein DFH06DRAFT_1192782 [Mycena polygramma]
MRKDLSETIHALPLVYAQIAELYEAGSGAPNLLVTELWESHRVHGESIRQHGLGITDISGRLLPALLARIDSLQALVTQLNAKVDTLTLTATVPGSSSKRAREDDAEFEARNVRARADADGSAPFVYAPPVLLAPLVIPERTPAAPLRAPPAAPPAVQSAPPAAPPAVLRAPPAAPQATLRAPPLAPRAPPRPAAPPRPSAPAGTGAVPPRAAAVQTARPPTDVEVLFGPVRWNKDHAQRPLVKQDIAGLIEAVIPEGSIYEFTTRRCKSHDHRFTLVAFASADIADWVATAWTFANHGDYIETYAVYPPNV